MLIFTYGTLMRGFETCEEALRLTAQLTEIGKGEAPGLMYDLGAYPGAVKDEHGSTVRGVLYSVKDGLLAGLDAYEGSAFKRKEVVVQLNSGLRMPAQMYYYMGKLDRVVPNGDWSRHGRV